MIRSVDLHSYLPPFMQEYQEIKEAYKAEEPEFAIVWDAVNRVLNNEFIETADENGIGRFEKILGILPFKEDTLESRRARVSSRWFNAIPYTMKSFLSKLAALCGETNFTVIKQFSLYRVYIDTNLELFGQVEELEKVIQLMMPCNMVVVSRNSIPCMSSGKTGAGGCMVFTELISAKSN